MDDFRSSLNDLNQEMVITFSARVAQSVSSALTEDSGPRLALTVSQNVQVVNNMEELGEARNAQGACCRFSHFSIVLT